MDKFIACAFEFLSMPNRFHGTAERLTRFNKKKENVKNVQASEKPITIRIKALALHSFRDLHSLYCYRDVRCKQITEKHNRDYFKLDIDKQI